MKTTNRPAESLIVHLDAEILRYLGHDLMLAAAEDRLPAAPIVPSFDGVHVDSAETVTGTIRPGAKNRVFS